MHDMHIQKRDLKKRNGCFLFLMLRFVFFPHSDCFRCWLIFFLFIFALLLYYYMIVLAFISLVYVLYVPSSSSRVYVRGRGISYISLYMLSYKCIAFVCC